MNLSPDKAAVLREAYRALAPGGEMYFSDVYADRRLPQEVSKLGGASVDCALCRLPRSAEQASMVCAGAFLERCSARTLLGILIFRPP